MKPVSVIIPTYNCAEYLVDAIKSILCQTYREIEVIVIDDGSTDDTRELVSELEKRYPNRIKYIYQDNSGVSVSRNTGIRNASGDYIAFLDADDVWRETKVEKQVACLDKNPEIGFVYCNNEFIDKDDKIIPGYFQRNILPRGDILMDLFCEYLIYPSGVMIRKSCFSGVGCFNDVLRVGEDYEFFLRLAHAYKCDALNEKLWDRRVLDNSLSRQDFALDARNDLQTLFDFVAMHTDFFKLNKKRIEQRFSDYYFSFGYNCLRRGMKMEAFQNLFDSLKYRFSLKACKSILMCAIPLALLNQFSRRSFSEKDSKYAKS